MMGTEHFMRRLQRAIDSRKRREEILDSTTWTATRNAWEILLLNEVMEWAKDDLVDRGKRMAKDVEGAVDTDERH
jgi:hypothetical protein